MNRAAKALTWTELRVGVVTIVSLVVLAITIVYVGSGGGSPWARKYELKALMSDINGLKPGAPVRVGGLEVGTVKHVDFDRKGGMVEVTMKLDRRVQPRVTTKSQATLGSMGLLGEKAVDITASVDGAPIEDGGYISAAAEDPFKGLLAETSESTSHLNRILARMDAGEGTMGKALRDEELYNRMVDVSVRLQGVMNKLESPAGPLGRLVNDNEMSRQLSSSVKGIDSIVARVNEGKGPLGALSRDEQLVADLKSLTSNLNEVAGKLHRGEGSAGRLLHDDALFRRLDSVSTRLDSLIGRVESGEGSAGRLIKDPEFYNNVNGAATDLRGLISDIRKDPQKYLRVKVSLF
jgi:phospholipid/cholesterol/gamma-HCH transport system substrate-binding protein